MSQREPITKNDELNAGISEPTIERGEYSLDSVEDKFGDDTVKTKELSFDNEVSLKQLSEYKYASLFGMIREYIANSIATTLEASEKIGDGYTPLIHVGYQRNLSLVQIIDNGMGLPEKIIEEVCTEGGKTTNWSDPDKPGRHGIGMISAFKGVGNDGVFYMETRSRTTGEHIKGFWTGEKFIQVENVDARLEDEQYGTFFEFPLKQKQQIRKFVKRASWWSPVPVQYTEYTGDKTPVFDDEFGGTDFLEEADPESVIVYENEYVKAVNAPKRDRFRNYDIVAGVDGNNSNAPNIDTTIIGIPIKRNHDTGFVSLPYNKVYVNIKKEARFVVENSIHEGKIVLSSSDYTSLSNEGEDMDKFVVEESVEEDAIILPMPAGDRDRLQKNPIFWSWLETQLENKYNKLVNNFFHQYNNKDSYSDIDQSTRNTFRTLIEQKINSPSLNNARKSNNLKRNIEYFETSIEKKLTNKEKTLIIDLYQEVKVYKKNGKTGKSVSMKLWNVLENELGDNGDIFLSYIPTDKKCHVVWQDNDDNVILKVTNSELYNSYEEEYNWTKLKSISEDTIDQFNVSDSIRNQFKNSNKQTTNKNAGKKAEERELTVYGNRGHKKSSVASVKWRTNKGTYTANNLKDVVAEEDSIIDRVILIPTNSEYKISDYKKVVGTKYCKIARCAVKTADYLTQFDGITTLENEVETYNKIVVQTSDGERKWEELTREYANIFVHIPSNDEIRQLVSTEKGKEIAKEIFIDANKHKRTSINEENSVYVTLTKEELNELYVGTAIKSPPTEVFFMHPANMKSSSKKIISPFYLPSDVFNHGVSMNDEMKIFVGTKIPHLKGTDVYGYLGGRNYTQTMKSIVKLIENVDLETAKAIIKENKK